MFNPFKRDELLKTSVQYTRIYPGVIVWNNAALAAAVPWTTLNVAAFVPAWARGIGVNLFLTAVVIGAGVYCRMMVRQDPSDPGALGAVREHTATAIVGVGVNAAVIVPLTDARTFQYTVIVGAGWTINVGIQAYCYT